jgi:hypothetical protein
MMFSTYEEHRAVVEGLRALLYPGAYMVLGVGWCGPGWQHLERVRLGAPVAIRNRLYQRGIGQ